MTKFKKGVFLWRMWLFQKLSGATKSMAGGLHKHRCLTYRWRTNYLIFKHCFCEAVRHGPCILSLLSDIFFYLFLAHWQPVVLICWTNATVGSALVGAKYLLWILKSFIFLKNAHWSRYCFFTRLILNLSVAFCLRTISSFQTFSDGLWVMGLINLEYTIYFESPD